MSLNIIAVEQREKEVKALKSFLTFSTIGSIILHGTLLASGIGNLLTRVPSLDEQPIELTIDPEVKQTPPPVEAKQEKEVFLSKNERGTAGAKVLTAGGGGSGDGSISLGGGSSATQLGAITERNIVTPKTNSPAVVGQKQTPSQPFVPLKKPVEEFNELPNKLVQRDREQQKVEPQKTAVSEAEKPIEKVQKEVAPTQQQENTTREKTPTNQITSSNPSSGTQPSQSVSAGGDKLRNILGNIRDSRASQESAGNSSGELGKPAGRSNSTSSTLASGNGNGFGTGTGSGTGSGNGSGIGFGTGTRSGNGTGSGTGTGNGTGTGSTNGNGTSKGNGNSERPTREIIATQPTQPKVPTEIERSNGNGRAACRDCKTQYSERARRRGAEGRVEVAVDTDKDGNVTNVRLAHSSGDRDLDEEHLRQAREWKLKPSEGGRQAVSIATEYAIQGSRRHRQVNERKQQREEQERQQQVATSSDASNNNSGEAPRRRRSLEASANTNNSDAPVSSSRRRRNLDTASSNSEESNNSRLSRRLRRQVEATSRSSEDSTPNRRVRREQAGSEESSFGSRLRRQRVEKRDGEEARQSQQSATSSRRRKREITADVRTSGEQQIPTRRRRREFKQSDQSSDSGTKLRNALRRSSESAPTSTTRENNE
jgi:TonB family protein